MENILVFVIAVGAIVIMALCVSWQKDQGNSNPRQKKSKDTAPVRDLQKRDKQTKDQYPDRSLELLEQIEINTSKTRYWVMVIGLPILISQILTMLESCTKNL